MAEKQTKAPAPVEAEKSAREAALEAEIAQLKAALERQKAASRGYTPAAASAAFVPPEGVQLRPFMVSLDHVHKGLVTPSPWFEHEKPGDPRGRPIMAMNEQHAKSIFQELHGIAGVTGPGPEAREMTAEELEAGDWGPPPQPGPKQQTRVPEKPKRKPQREPRNEEERQQDGMVRNKVAQAEALQF